MSAATKFHASLNVSDLARSAAFYRVLLGVEAARLFDDYAKFEIQDPPLVLSLMPGRPGSGGTLNHLGLRLPDAEALVRWQFRLESAGVATQREDGVACCHSSQTKFWVTDPDRILWEIYIVDEEKDERGGHVRARDDTPQPAAAPRLVWRHDLPDPFPVRIPHEDNTLHEVALEGTANLAAAAANLERMLTEVYRVLRPGGEVALHGLAGDRPWTGAAPNLPGPAAKVEYVPVETEPLRAMGRAGFVQVRFEKFSPAPFFEVGGVQMREILLTGRKPGHRPERADHHAVYLGPLARVEDDFGNMFARGQRVALNIHDWQSLSQSAAAGQFLFLSPEKGGGAAPSRKKNMLAEKPWKIEAVGRLFLGVITTFCLGGVAAGLLGHFTSGWPKAQSDFWQIVISASFLEIPALAWIGLFLRHHSVNWKEAFGFRLSSSATAAAGGVLAALLFVPAAWGLQMLSDKLMDLAHWNAQDQPMVQELQDPSLTVAEKTFLGVVAVVFAPVVEEMLFRGLLYPALKRQGWPRLALWGSSALFALVHFNVATFVPLLVFALLLVYLYETFENLLAPIVAHSLFNAANFLALIFKDQIARALHLT